jgi:hypothetical protein
MTRSNVDEIVPVSDLIPWKAVDISYRPYQGFFSMNPCIHVEPDGTWLCLLRCTDYAMPGGQTVRSPRAKPSLVQSKNAMVVLDPKTWKPIKTYPVRELDGLPRVASCSNTGYEDVRIFRTELGGLQGIAASLHLERPAQRPGGSHPPEQVLVTFGESYDIVSAKPIRGKWSSTPQKNWMPFEGVHEPRFLYSIERGTIFSEDGPLNELPAAAPINARPRNLGTTEVRVFRSPKAVSAGRVSPPTYDGVRGGSQLLSVGDNLWLGLGHEMRYTHGKKFYWHGFFTIDGAGKLIARGRPIKLATEGIEFAAGMAHEGDRLIVSYGVDDGQCRLAETSLSAVLESLQPIEIAEDDFMPPMQRDEPVSVTNMRAPRVISVQAGMPSSQRDSAPMPRMSARVGTMATAVASAQAKVHAAGAGVVAVGNGLTPTLSATAPNIIAPVNGATAPVSGTAGAAELPRPLHAEELPRPLHAEELLAAAEDVIRQRRGGSAEAQRDAWSKCMAALDAYGAAALDGK